jgi:serine/threonine protein kinase
MVLELCEGGELFDRIVKKSYYNEKEARDVIKALLTGIQYCHQRKVAVRLPAVIFSSIHLAIGRPHISSLTLSTATSSRRICFSRAPRIMVILRLQILVSQTQQGLQRM